MDTFDHIELGITEGLKSDRGWYLGNDTKTGAPRVSGKRFTEYWDSDGINPADVAKILPFTFEVEGLIGPYSGMTERRGIYFDEEPQLRHYDDLYDDALVTVTAVDYEQVDGVVNTDRVCVTFTIKSLGEYV